MLATPDGGRTYEGGATIFRQGDAANGEAYLVHEGIVEVSRVEDAGERRVPRTLSQGELLGEWRYSVRGRTRRRRSRLSR